jgi:hypothetical protein
MPSSFGVPFCNCREEIPNQSVYVRKIIELLPSINVAVIALSEFIIKANQPCAVTAIIQPVFVQMAASRDWLGQLPNDNLHNRPIGHLAFAALKQLCLHVDNHVVTFWCFIMSSRLAHCRTSHSPLIFPAGRA